MYHSMRAGVVISALLAQPLLAQTTLVLEGRTKQRTRFEIFVGAVGQDPERRSSRVDKRDGVEVRVDENVDALHLRNALVPEAGIGEGHLQLKRVHVAGRPAIRETGNLTEQFWVRADNGPWAMLEPSLPLEVYGVTFTAIEHGTTDRRGDTLVPLAVGLLLGLGIASGLMRKRAGGLRMRRQRAALNRERPGG